VKVILNFYQVTCGCDNYFVSVNIYNKWQCHIKDSPATRPVECPVDTVYIFHSVS